MPAAADGQASVNDFDWYEDADSEEPFQRSTGRPSNHKPTLARPSSTPTVRASAGPKPVQHPRVAELRGKTATMPRSSSRKGSSLVGSHAAVKQAIRRSSRKRKAPSPGLSQYPQQSKRPRPTTIADSSSESDSDDSTNTLSTQDSSCEQNGSSDIIDVDLQSNSDDVDVSEIIDEALDSPVIVS